MYKGSVKLCLPNFMQFGDSNNEIYQFEFDAKKQAVNEIPIIILLHVISSLSNQEFFHS